MDNLYQLFGYFNPFSYWGENNPPQDKDQDTLEDESKESWIVMEFTDFGGVQTLECQSKTKHGIWYLDPRKTLEASDEDYAYRGYPCEAKTEEDYLQQICCYRGEKLFLKPMDLGALFYSAELNIPSDLKVSVTGRELIVPQQFYIDIPRTSWISFNGERLKREDHWSDFERVSYCYQALLEVCDRDDQLSWGISKLMTQASMGRIFTLLYHRFAHPELKVHMTAGTDRKVFVWTKDRDTGESLPYIAIEMTDVFPLRRCGESHEVKPLCKYIKAGRYMEISKEALKEGKIGEPKVVDLFSRFYDSEEAAANQKFFV